MPLPELVGQYAAAVVGRYCENKVPPHVRDQIQVSYKIQNDTITIYESRPHWQKPDVWTERTIAQFRYNTKDKLWTLYNSDRNNRWHKHPATGPAATLDPLLEKLDNDPAGIFWG
jgi:hypothetical protein